jgi:hypothetical protein
MLEPGTPAARAMYRDTAPTLQDRIRARRRARRAAGTWKKPARHPCSFTAANGVRCDLESIRLWFTYRDGRILSSDIPRLPRGLVSYSRLGEDGATEITGDFRCALHPVKTET